MSLSVSHTPAIDLPDDTAWLAHCETLARRAGALKDPVAAARCLHELGWIRLHELGDEAGATQAWRSALKACPTRTPTLLALRGIAVETNDRDLAETLFDQSLDLLREQTLADGRDAIEILGFFALLWIFLWPQSARAHQALEALEVHGDPDGLSARLGPLVATRTQRIAQLRRQLDDTSPRAPLGEPGQARREAELGDLLDAESKGSGKLLIRRTSKTDAFAAWRWAELTYQTGRFEATVEALEHLAHHCTTAGGAGALRFVAAELLEFLVGDTQAASERYAQSSAGDLRTIIAVKGLLSAFKEGAGSAYAELLADRAGELADPVLHTVLAIRAAHLFERQGALGKAWTAARLALPRGGDPARTTLERLAWQTRRFSILAELFDGGPTTPANRVGRATAWGVALDDPNTALDALGPLQRSDARSLLSLRLRDMLTCRAQRAQRAEDGRGPEAFRGACREISTRQTLHELSADRPAPRLVIWQHEANVLTEGERCAELYLQIARAYLSVDGMRDKALTYLFWVLDHNSTHLTALRLIATACRSGNRLRPLMEALARTLPLLDRATDRFPVEFELAELWERVDSGSERAAGLYRDALTDCPADPAPLRALERLLDAKPGALDAVYSTALGGTLSDAVREAITQKRAALTPARVPIEETPTPSDEAKPEHSGLDGLPDLLDSPLSDDGLDTLLTAMESAVEHSQVVFESELPPQPLISPDTAPLPLLFADRIDAESPAGTLADLSLSEAPPAQERALDFLGAERALARSADPGRAIILAKLARSRAPLTDWPTHDSTPITEAAAHFAQADDSRSRHLAAVALATAYEAEHHTESAIKALETAMGHQADSEQVIHRLTQLYTRTERWERLAALVERQAEGAQPEEASRLLLQAAALRESLEHPEAAHENFHRAHQLQPLDSEALWRWVAVLEVLDRAATAGELLVQRYPNPQSTSPNQAAQIGGLLLYRLDDAARALPYFVYAAAGLPDRVDVLADAAQAEAQIGLTEQAARRLRSAIATLNGSDETPDERRRTLRVRLARIFETANEPAAARQAWLESLEDGPHSPAILRHIEQVGAESDDGLLLAGVAEHRLEAARAMGAPPQRLRDLAARLGQIRFQKLADVSGAASAFVEAFEHRPLDLDLYRIAEHTLARHPIPQLSVRLYTAFLSAHAPAGARKTTVELRLAAAREQAGDLEAAIDGIAAMQALFPENAEVRQAHARLLRKAKRWPALITLHREELAHAETPEAQASCLRWIAQAQEVGLRDLDAAVTTWMALLAIDGGELTTLRALARLLEALKRWDALVAISERELSQTTGGRQKAYIHFRIGGIFETELDDLKQAVAHYERALNADPRCFPALHGLRELAVQGDRHEEVLSLLERELTLWDAPREQAAILARIAELHDAQGDEDLAIATYEKAITVWSQCVPAAQALANRLFDAGRFAEAAPYFQTLSAQNLDKRPKSERSALFYKRGRVAFELGRRAEALESLKLSLDFDPINLDALDALVRLSAGRGAATPSRVELDVRLSAAETVAKARADDGLAADLLRLRGAGHEASLALDLAADTYQLAIDRAPNRMHLAEALAHLEVRRRRWPEAAAALRQITDRHWSTAPERPEHAALCRTALTQEARIWTEGAGQPATALGCWRKVLQLDSDDHAVRFEMAQCHFLLGAREDARDLVLQILAEFSTDAISPAIRARYTFYLGRIHQVLFQAPDAAAERYRRAIGQDPDSAEAHLALLRVLAQQQRALDLEQAVHEARPVIEAPARSAAAIALKIFAARLLDLDGQHRSAAALLEPLAARRGPEVRPAQFALIESQLRAGQPEAAARVLYRALDASVCDPDGLRVLVDLHTAHGDADQRLSALSALEVFDGLDDAGRRDLETLSTAARRRRAKAIKPIGKQALFEHLAPPGFGSPLLRLWRRLESTLEQRLEPRTRPPTPKVGLVSLRKHPFGPHLKLILTLTGLKHVDLVLAPGAAGDLISVWGGPQPLIWLDPEGLSTAEQRFFVGRAAFLARSGLALMHDDAAARLDTLASVHGLFSAETLGGSAPRFDLEGVPDSVRAAVDAVITESQRPLQGVALPQAATDAAALAADRIGYLCCGDLRASVTALSRLRGRLHEAAQPGMDLTWLIRSDARLQDLIKFALSEPALHIRQLTALAI